MKSINKKIELSKVNKFHRNLFRQNRIYSGKIKAAIFDWSGTLVDPYSIGPLDGIMTSFKNIGVDFLPSEVRESMGKRKDFHIQDLIEKSGKNINFFDFYSKYLKYQYSILPKYSEMILFSKEILDFLKKYYNLKIGVTTGYTNNMSNIILEEIKKQGFSPDFCVSGDDVINGSRPNPFMIYRNMSVLNISNPASVVKIDDTKAGIEEGNNAGCWTVGIAGYSTYMEINSMEEFQKLSLNQYNKKLELSRQELAKSSPHYIIDYIYNLPFVIEDINENLAKGITPI